MEQSAEKVGSTRSVSKKVRVVRKAGAKKAPIKKLQKQSGNVALTESQVFDLILEHRENGRKLARSILRKWRVRMPMDEIDSVVDLSLCEAAKRYDSSKGAAFMTFYFYHLRGHLVRTVSKAAQASNIFTAFAKSTGFETEEWSQVDAETIWGYVPDESVFGRRESETPEHCILRSEKIEECRGALSKLDALEQEVLKRSFEQEQPLVDIAKSLGYSRCHISRVKKAALDRLKVIIARDTDIVDSSASDDLELNTPKVMTRRRSRRRPVVKADLKKKVA